MCLWTFSSGQSLFAVACGNVIRVDFLDETWCSVVSKDGVVVVVVVVVVFVVVAVVAIVIVVCNGSAGGGGGGGGCGVVMIVVVVVGLLVGVVGFGIGVGEVVLGYRLLVSVLLCVTWLLWPFVGMVGVALIFFLWMCVFAHELDDLHD